MESKPNPADYKKLNNLALNKKNKGCSDPARAKLKEETRRIVKNGGVSSNDS